MDHPAAIPIHKQVEYLEHALSLNQVAQTVLIAAADIGLPNWYLGAGGVVHTVWNLLHGFEVQQGIRDYDLVYFDPKDLSPEAESRLEDEVTHRLGNRNVTVDVKNEARVHLWYEQEFGRRLDPYISTEDAISSWPTTASSVGVRRDERGFIVYAPYGLSDLLGIIARPNKALVAREVYEEKVARWAARWPRLRVIPW